MKKNKMMRIASVLLVAVILTTCAISGTFAKYVTSGSINDSARVAKWGVTIGAEGTLFSTTYKDSPVAYQEGETGRDITVQALTSANTDVVAPGTKNEDGMTFTLTGTPEVDTEIKIAVTSKDITYKASDTDTAYNPVVFTLKNGTGDVLSTGTLATIEAYLEGLSKVYDTNTNLANISANTDGTYKLTWAWDFDDNGNGTNDVKDTALGNIAAGTVTNSYSNVDTSFAITITATQID